MLEHGRTLAIYVNVNGCVLFKALYRVIADKPYLEEFP